MNRRREILVAMSIAALGAVLAYLHRDLPLLRNSLIYVQMVASLVENGFDVGAVTNRFELSYGRPVGFPLLAAPFVPALGATDAVRLAGGLSTLPFLGVCWAFFRVYDRRFDVPEAWVPAQLALCFANPLSLYQFWAAYPDALFAAIVIAFVMMADRVLEHAEEVHPSWIVATGAVAVAGMVLKHYGLILAPMGVVHGILRWREVGVLLSRRDAAVTVVLVAGTIAWVVITARAGANPLLNLDSRAGGFEGFVDGVRQISFPLANNLLLFAGFALLCLHVALPLGLRRPRLGREQWILVVVFGVYVVGLLTYYMAWFNARFFLPVLPLAVLLLARAWKGAALPAWLRRVGPLLFAVIALGLCVNYNSRTVHRALAGWNEAIDEQRRLRNIVDSLRMTVHLEVDRSLDRLEEVSAAGDRVFYVSAYNGDAGHHVYEMDGRLRHGLAVVYVPTIESVSEQVGPGEDYLLFLPREQLPAPAPPSAETARRLGLEDLGAGVYRGRRPGGP